MQQPQEIKISSAYIYAKLQEHLAGHIVELCGCEFKRPVESVICADGTSLSVQASSSHWCLPREDVGPYTHVEVWRIRKGTEQLAEISEFEYSMEEPSGCVPIESVILFIANHGGFKE